MEPEGSEGAGLTPVPVPVPVPMSIWAGGASVTLAVGGVFAGRVASGRAAERLNSIQCNTSAVCAMQ